MSFHPITVIAVALASFAFGVICSGESKSDADGLSVLAILVAIVLFTIRITVYCLGV